MVEDTCIDCKYWNVKNCKCTNENMKGVHVSPTAICYCRFFKSKYDFKTQIKRNIKFKIRNIKINIVMYLIRTWRIKTEIKRRF